MELQVTYGDSMILQVTIYRQYDPFQHGRQSKHTLPYMYQTMAQHVHDLVSG